MTYLCWRCSRKDDTHTGTCRACLKDMRPPEDEWVPPPPDRAVGGYAYLMCEDAVPMETTTAEVSHEVEATSPPTDQREEAR